MIRSLRGRLSGRWKGARAARGRHPASQREGTNGSPRDGLATVNAGGPDRRGRATDGLLRRATSFNRTHHQSAYGRALRASRRLATPRSPRNRPDANAVIDAGTDPDADHSADLNAACRAIAQNPCALTMRDSIPYGTHQIKVGTEVIWTSACCRAVHDHVHDDPRRQRNDGQGRHFQPHLHRPRQLSRITASSTRLRCRARSSSRPEHRWRCHAAAIPAILHAMTHSGDEGLPSVDERRSSRLTTSSARTSPNPRNSRRTTTTRSTKPPTSHSRPATRLPPAEQRSVANRTTTSATADELPSPAKPLTHDTKPFRQRVLGGETVLGMFINLGSPMAAELCGNAGFDYLIIDMEHGLTTDATLVGMLHATASTPATAVVRVEEGTRLRVGRALDFGAPSLMVPQVKSAEEAARVASFVRYPPTGVRGIALPTRGAGYGAITHADVATAHEKITLMIQIEGRSAVDQAAEIASIDGVDVLFVGPTDLIPRPRRTGRHNRPGLQERHRACGQGRRCSRQSCRRAALEPGPARPVPRPGLHGHVDRLGRRLHSRRGARRGAGVQAAAVLVSCSTYSAIDGRASNFSRK